MRIKLDTLHSKQKYTYTTLVQRNIINPAFEFTSE